MYINAWKIFSSLPSFSSLPQFRNVLSYSTFPGSSTIPHCGIFSNIDDHGTSAASLPVDGPWEPLSGTTTKRSAVLIHSYSNMSSSEQGNRLRFRCVTSLFKMASRSSISSPYFPKFTHAVPSPARSPAALGRSSFEGGASPSASPSPDRRLTSGRPRVRRACSHYSSMDRHPNATQRISRL